MLLTLHVMPLHNTAMMISDSRAMAQIRHLLMTALDNSFPAPRTIPELEHECKVPYMAERKAAWHKDAIKEQLRILLYAGLIRTARNGYTLTEKGRRDRQEVARFFNSKQPQDAA
jgi:predicted transcriptional regulator